MLRPRALVLCLALAACGEDGPPPDILVQLQAVPSLVSVEEQGTNQAGYRYFLLEVDQPVDHDHPEGNHFLQLATLIHRDVDAPMILAHTGYGDWLFDHPTEPTLLLDGNQIVVEHRFFRGSRPAGVEAWADLNIRQAAADDHAIVDALRPIYGGAWIETGASKGGMTSIYHRRFYPDDVDGTIAYVAPISFAAPDYRYEAHVEQLGPPACRQAIRDLQVELLAHRRQMLVDKATFWARTRGYNYSRVTIPAAVESAVVGLEWSFWQFEGVASCPTVPAVDATDDQVWTFLDQVSPVSGSSDSQLSEFEAYYYQADVELGYPGTMDEHLDGLLQFGAADYEGSYPVGVPRPGYQAAAMTDVDGWVRTAGLRLIFLYGEWDPWTGGAFDLGAARDSLRVVAPQASHLAGIDDLSAADRAAVLGRLAAWTGVTPDARRVAARRAPERGPRPPSAWLRLRPRPLGPQLPPAVVQTDR